WDIVRLLVHEGASVLLTTQYLDEADQLADRIAVIDHGKVIAEGTAPQLKASVGSGAVNLRVAEPGQREEAARIVGEVLGGTVTLGAESTSLDAQVPESNDAAVARVLPALHAAGIAVPEFSLGQPSLDEVFLALTGRVPEAEDKTEDHADQAYATEEVR